jgi:sugar lactone lactonase YvrE
VPGDQTVARAGGEVNERRGGVLAGVSFARRLELLTAVLVVAALATGFLACASGPLPEPAWNTPAVRRVWPQDSDRPRIEYLGVLRSARDLGAKVSAWQRFKTVLFGEDETGMVRPIAIAKNRAGMLVVADPSARAVHLFDLAARKYGRLGEDPDARLTSPVGVAIDESGRVYVADSVAGKVFVFDASGTFVSEMGADDLIRPTGVALDPLQQELYVVDTAACQVVVFGRAGRKLRSFGRRGVGLGEFNAPTFITVAADGTISVSDSLNYRIQRFHPDGSTIAAFGKPGNATGHFARPKGVAADTAGRLYVVDAAFENVQIFDPEGRLLLPFGGPGTGPGEFTLPGGVFLDSSNTIWVADSFNRRVQVFRLLVDQER